MTTDPFLDMAEQAIAGVASDDEARGVIAMIEAEKRRYRAVQMFGGALPPGPLEQALELDGDFRVRAHLSYLSERIAAAVRRVEAGESVYLRVSMPPRYGKTRMIGWATPVWLLRKHPDWSIVLTSNESNLATLSSRQVRRTIENDPGLGVTLASDAGAVQEWETSRGGGVVARGLVGNLVGRGARCVSGDTRILTDRGYITAERAFDLGITRILAYDHVTNRAVWRRVEAAQRTPSRRVVEVTTTSGRVLTCTPDHPIYTSRGYVPAGQLRNGEALVAVMGGCRVPPMPDALPATDARPSEVDTPGVQPVLHAGVRGSWTSGHAAHEVVPLRESGAERRDLLLTGMSCRSEATASTARQGMPPVRADVPAPELTSDLLLPALLQCSPLDSDERQRQLPLQDGDLIQQMVPADAPADPEPGRPDVRCMRRVPDHHIPTCDRHSDTLGVDRASHQRTPGGQPPSESHHPVSPVPCCAPQIQADTVALVQSRGDETYAVYDFQVEGTRNFFADGVLVHNCLIMDDMVKSFVAAHSPVTREAVWNWWLNVAQMRLEHPVLVIAVGTRWHQDDFLGRLGSDEYEGDPGRWEDISLPAFAEEGDLLGRAPGEPLISPLRDETPAEATETLEAVKVSAGTYAFAAQFQARPAPAQGAIFDTTWWRYWTTNPKRVTPDDPTVVLLDPVELVKPNRARVIESWDCAFKDTDGSDYVVGQWWAKQGVRRYLLDQTRNRLSFNATVKAMQEWAQDHRTTYARYVEDKANGTAVIDVLKDTVEGMLPINPTNSKEARARAVTPECEAGNVYLPHPSDPGNEWVAGLLSELRQFPHDVHDDQVDALTQALTQLRDMGEVTITVPGNARGGNPLVAQHSRSLGKRPNVSPIRRTR